jgi:hypothetical protein
VYGQVAITWFVQQVAKVGPVTVPTYKVVHRDVSAPAIANALKSVLARHRSMQFKLIVQSCFAGRFLDFKPLQSLTQFIGASSGPLQPSTGAASLRIDALGWNLCPATSYYTQQLITNLRNTPPYPMPQRLAAAAGKIGTGPNGENPVFWDGHQILSGPATGEGAPQQTTQGGQGATQGAGSPSGRRTGSPFRWSSQCTARQL